MKRVWAIVLAIVLLFSAGARAQSPNERVHVLQKRDYSVKNKTEISLFGGLSVDDIFTQHYTVTVAIDYHIDEAFALEGMWMSCKLPFFKGSKAEGTSVAFPTGYEDDWVRWGHGYTDAFEDIKDDVQLSPSNADLAMISNYLGLNVQFSPIYGKFSLFNWGLAHADFYITAGGGIATTELKTPDNLWVDTGTYFTGNFGVGFRVFLARWLALRFDVRDFTFAARVGGEGGAATEAAADTKIRNTLFVLVGISFLFGGEEPVQVWSPY